MDIDKLKIFQSGMTEEERELVAKQESVEAKFKEEKDEIDKVMRMPGFKLILDKIVIDLEVSRFKLLDCKEKDLRKLQTEVKVRREFLDKWTPYQE